MAVNKLMMCNSVGNVENIGAYYIGEQENHITNDENTSGKLIVFSLFIALLGNHTHGLGNCVSDKVSIRWFIIALFIMFLGLIGSYIQLHYMLDTVFGLVGINCDSGVNYTMLFLLILQLYDFEVLFELVALVLFFVCISLLS